MSYDDKRKNNRREVESQLTNIDIGLKDGVFIFTKPMTVGEFANKMKISPNQIIVNFFKKGLVYNINHTLNEEAIAELCLELGYDFQKENQISAQNFMDEIQINDDPRDLVKRPPIVTIMGHVDHGKTTLIDKIRNSHIASTEHGGITQHTGAYQVKNKDSYITFLDTPGHKAFSAMRARGAKVTDIVVLVVAADDGVMLQTREAIDHAKAAKVPIIVFVNKMDKPGADKDKIKNELSQVDIVSEEWGGDTQFVYGSALTNQGIDELLDAIVLQSDMLELKANPKRLAIGTVIESKIDRGKGPVTTLIIENGTLIERDFIVAGSNYGRIRTMDDSLGQKLTSATPGTPVVITGLNYSPKAGDRFFGFKDEKFAKELAEEKKDADKQDEINSRSVVTYEDNIKIVNVIVKADTQGTTEALANAIRQIENDEVKVNIVRQSIGLVNESDVILAEATKAFIYTFNMKLNQDVKNLAEEKRIVITNFDIIYELIEHLEKVIKNMMAPTYEENPLGEAQILKVISSSKVGRIAGCMMVSGMVKSGSKVRVYRKDNLIHEGTLDSLQHGKDSVKKMEKGKEFGCHIKKFEDIIEDDILRFYELVEVDK